MATPSGGRIFELRALRGNWSDPETRLLLLWRGSRALGLHPWHKEVLGLTTFQLHWASVQAREDAGGEARKQWRAEGHDAVQRQAMELIVWADNHLSRGPK